MNNRLNVLGNSLDNYDCNQTAELIINRILNGSGGYQVSINTFKLLESRKSPILRAALEKATVISADGASMVWAAKIHKLSKVHRVPGIDLAEQLIDSCEKQDIPIYLYGSTRENIAGSVNALKMKFKNLKIVGFQDGYQKNLNDGQVLKEIIESGAKLCLIALPSPKKELLAQNYANASAGIFFLPVGGAFEVFSGAKVRAPKIIQHVGLEWLYRLIQDPKRLFIRYLSANSYFAYLLIKYFFRKN